jgi:hypothetical protein
MGSPNGVFMFYFSGAAGVVLVKKPTGRSAGLTHPVANHIKNNNLKYIGA